MAKVSTRDMAAKLLEQARQDGKIPTNPPDFSAGTLNPDAPIAAQPAAQPAPEFTTGTVDPAALPDTAPVVAAPNAETPAQATDAAPDRQRGADGRFVGDAPTEQPQAQAQEAGAQAAEDAAAQMVDPFADYEDVEYDDPDTGEKFTVKAKKDIAKRVAGGYTRRSMLNRAQTYLGEAKNVLEPLITSGQMRQLLPLIARAMQDEEYGNFVVDGYNRRIAGQPLIAQAIQEAAQAGAAQVAPPQYVPPQYAPPDYGEADPFLATVIGAQLTPLQAQLEEVRAAQASMAQAQQQAWQRQQDEARQRQEQALTIQAAHQDLARRYPDEFTGDLERDGERLNPIFRYAKESRLVDTYGVRAGIVLAADTLRQARAEAASPAAEQIADLNRSVEAAAQAATRAQAEAARVVGGGAPVPPPPPKAPPKPPSVFKPDGTRKSPGEYAEDVVKTFGLRRPA